MATTFDRPNPDTPLAFLPPDTADQYEISRYLLVATAGMFSWDVLCNLRGDYRLLTEYRFTLSTFVYFVSRIASFAYVITGVVFETQGVPDCLASSRSTGWCFVVAVPATSLLIYFRVRAVFNADKYIVALFSFLWLGVLAGSLTVPFAIAGGHIGPTSHCINTSVKPFASAGVIVFTVNDTLAFIFISWRLLQSPSVEGSFKAQARSFLSGKGLPAFTRAVLQSGQEYYLITVGGNILTMAMILAPPSLPLVYHAMFTVPNIAIGNSMACRVYRYIKFGRISPNMTTIRSNSNHNTGAEVPPFRKPTPRRTTFDTTTFAPDVEEGAEGVRIETTVERSCDSDKYCESDIPMTVVKFPPKAI